MQPKVSVIIPVYNVEKYLKQCLDSVVNQTLEDIEIILVDDGSTDKSLDISKEYAQKDNRIKIIQQQNKGAAAARNAGLSTAQGDYLYFMDSDDFVNIDALEKSYLQISKTDSDICIFKYNIYDDTKEIIKEPDFSWDTSIIEAKETFSYIDIPDKILQICTPECFIKLYKKSFITQLGINFQEIKTCNDVFFTYTTLIMADKITFLNETLVNYRKNHTTALSANRGKTAECIILALTKVKEYLQTQKRFDEVSEAFYIAAISNFYYELEFCNAIQKKKLLKQIKDFLPEKYGKNFTNGNFAERIFSIRNSYDKTHKIITILGIKIKLKRGIK